MALHTGGETGGEYGKETLGMQSYPCPPSELLEQQNSFYGLENNDPATAGHSATELIFAYNRRRSIAAGQDTFSPNSAAVAGQAQGQQGRYPTHTPSNLEELRLGALIPGAHHDTDFNLSVTAQDQATRGTVPHPISPSPYGTVTVPDQADAQSPTSYNVHARQLEAFVNAAATNAEPLSKKRSKGSQACDDCRRRKIRCDAQPDGSEQPCLNCSRAGTECLYTRVPRKRGPSKGYIRDLADRIYSIEGKLEVQPPPDESATHRGPFSYVSSPILLAGPAPSSAAATRGSDFQAPPLESSNLPTPSPTAAFAPATHAPGPLTPGFEPDRLQSLASSLVSSADQPRIDEAIGEVDETAYQMYLTAIHPFFPLLESDRRDLLARLSPNPPALREAFAQAFVAAIAIMSSLTAEGQHDPSSAARKLLAEIEEGQTRLLTSPTIDLLHVQALILLFIAADCRPQRLPGPSKDSLLARAVSIAITAKLYRPISVPASSASTPSFPPADASKDDICIRTWCVLVMLDRWNAIGSGAPTLIHEDSVVAPLELTRLLGAPAFFLFRLTTIISRASRAIVRLQTALDSSPSSDVLIGSFFDDWIEDIRLTLPSDLSQADHLMIHLAYWHCRFLAYLLNPSARSTDLLWTARNSVSLLQSHHPRLATPLAHHFASLTSLILDLLLRVGRVSDEASHLLRSLLNNPLYPPAWHQCLRLRFDPGSPRSDGTAHRNLRHLAYLATTSQSSNQILRPDAEKDSRAGLNYEDMGFDPRPLLMAGYLNTVRDLQ